MKGERFSLCVYCGSRPGTRAEYLGAAKAVGRAIGQRGWQLVYGGGNVGLMGALADAALAHGGHVVGVIPKSLVAREVAHLSLHEQLVVDTMHQRKQAMAERADAFLALPGGIGTLEELYEVWTWRHLGYHHQPIGLLNAGGFYDGLLAFMRHTVAEGFLSDSQLANLHAGVEPDALLDQLHHVAAHARGADDLGKI
ncbi:MAG: hypothetical protein RI988_2289 [Pseudomonadota bacterium]|jgi:uncharacterized protein (TIGR00730 family)